MRNRKNLIGQTFGRLTVIAEGKTRETKSKRKQYYWVCQCNCGSQPKEINQNSLLTGDIVSCGCYRSEHKSEYGFKHGMSNTRIYNIWSGIIQRCCNPNAHNYARYGGRGITICQDWLNSFVSFYKWAMGNGYADNLTIDRIDLDGDYSPSNCRWITQAEQNRNTSRIRWIEKNDGTKITSAEAARIAGLSRATVARWCRVDGIRTLQGILQRADEVHSRHSKGVKNSGEKILLAENDG